MTGYIQSVNNNSAGGKHTERVTCFYAHTHTDRQKHTTYCIS